MRRGSWSRLRARSLRGRLLTTALLLVSLFSVVAFSAFELLRYSRLQNALHEHIQLTAAINADVLATPYWYIDLANITSAIEAVLADEDVVAVVARDVDGSEMARAGRPATELGNASVAIRPVRFRDHEEDQLVGSLELWFEDSRISQELWRRLGLDALLFALLVCAVIFAVSAAEKRTFGIPLARLMASIKTSKEKGTRRAVDWESEDELGTLIREYNEMLSLQAATEAEKERESALLEATLENVGQGICVYDADLRLVAYNRRYLELLEQAPDTVRLGTPLDEMVRQNARRGEYGDINVEALVADRLSIARSQGAFRFERERPGGSIIEVESNPMPDGGFVSTFTDITERREFESRLRHLALHDGLTGLPNRSLFHDRLRQTLAASRRQRTPFAVLFVDLDRFKDLNDTMGHDQGDRLLGEVARRLGEATRETDTAARLGGDEFAVIQADLPDPDAAAVLAQRILSTLERPFEIGGRSFHCTASIGITLCPDDALDADQLVKNADLAMYAAKAEGRNRYRYFLPEMNAQVQERRQLEEHLRVAMAERQFVLYYQPQIDLASGSVIAAEALVRWHHPTRGLMRPGEFIPTAEDSGLILPLSEWVIEEACRQGASWRRAGVDLRMGVNISAHHFRHRGLIESVISSVDEETLSGRRLELEITEGTLISDAELAADTLHRLRDLGISIAIDDFGTGYSSLGYLKRFAIDSIKIDRSFVSDLEQNADDAAIVRAVIGLGQSLNLRVVAEGVEDEHQLDFLRRERCHEVQGYFYARPLPPDQFLAWLGTHQGISEAG